MKTKDKILVTALKLFNENNTQAATTNHIAKEMGISPGNLHYHYKNREEIIRHLYTQMRKTLTLSIESLPQTIIEMDEQINITAKIQWEYRFFQRELLFLLSRDPILKQTFIEDNIAHKQRIIISLKHVHANDELIVPVEEIFEVMADQLLLVSHFWIAHEETLGLQLTQENAHQVSLQIQAILRPYLTQKALKNLAILS